MKKVLFSLPILSLIWSHYLPLCANDQSSDFSGSNSITVSAGTSSSPKFYITSVATNGDAVFSGTVVDSGSGWDSNSSISFGSDTNSSGSTIYPFNSNGVFNPSVQIPDIGVTFDSSVSALSATYHGGYVNTGVGFAGGAPEIIIEGPSDGADGAEATAIVLSGQITGFTVTEGGSGYGNSTPPKVTVVGGPHFVKIVDEDSNYTGRVFLITDNKLHCVTLDTSRLAQGESTNLSTYFPVGTKCEVVPAPTLGTTFGVSTYSSSTASNEIPQNWTAGAPNSADWLYLWDTDTKGYKPYFFLDASYEGQGWGRGWYNKKIPSDGLKNNTVLYPDEAFIIAKRTSGDATFELEGAVETSDRQMFLPETGNQMLMNNPYGTDLLLGELIPSTAIGSGTNQFKPGSSATDTSMDVVTFLVGGTSTWLSYYYLSGVNDTVTAIRDLSVSSSASGSLTANDFYIGKGGVTALQSCTASNGTGLLTNGVSNDGNYTKITLSASLSPSGRAQPEVGFNITLADLQGYLLSDGGNYEANATTGEAVANTGINQGGSVVYSDLIGTHEVVGSGTGYVVIQKQRDVNFKSDEGTPAWSVGSEGAGYSSAANFYCVGGNNGTTDANATGTVNISGSTVSISVTASGSNYTSAPTAVTTGGGWRYQSDTNPQGATVLSASGGLLIKRRHSSGVKTYIDTLNPF